MTDDIPTQFALIQINAGIQALQEANDIYSVLDVRSVAAAAVTFYEAQGAAEAASVAKELQLRAERKAGQILKEMPKNEGTRGQLAGSTDGGTSGGFMMKPLENIPTLDDLDIDKNESFRWQLEAEVPVEVFEEYLDDKRAKGHELTAGGLIRIAMQQRRPKSANTPSYPENKYNCIVIDPPWPMKKIEREERPNQGVDLDYPTMTLEEIYDLPISDLANDDCHIYLWVTHKYLPTGLDLLKWWGFEYQCLMTWIKPTGMTPYSWMYNTEHVIFGHRGNLPLTQLGLKLSFEASVTKHSEKPEIFYERVIKASPEPRLEMFARKIRDGFDGWGNEVPDLG